MVVEAVGDGGLGGAVAVIFGLAMLLKLFYKKVDQGRAIIINKLVGDPSVRFTGGLVLPVIYRAETMDISLKTIELDRRGKEGLICKDNIRADIKVTFFVRVNKTAEDVMRVAQAVGVERASDQKTLEELFQAKFSEALKTVGKQMDFEDLYNSRDDFKDYIFKVIGTDLNGYTLDAGAIDYLEQTPVEVLDPDRLAPPDGRATGRGEDVGRTIHDGEAEHLLVAVAAHVGPARLIDNVVVGDVSDEERLLQATEDG